MLIINAEADTESEADADVVDNYVSMSTQLLRLPACLPIGHCVHSLILFILFVFRLYFCLYPCRGYIIFEHMLATHLSRHLWPLKVYYTYIVNREQQRIRSDMFTYSHFFKGLAGNPEVCIQYILNTIQYILNHHRYISQTSHIYLSVCLYVPLSVCLFGLLPA